MSTTCVERLVRGSRQRIYALMLDPEAVSRWKVPEGMHARVHAFEAREGGAIRVTLTYDGEGEGKTDAHSDTYSGCFVTLVPGERIVDRIAFETGDPSMRGVMTTTITLADAVGGTLVTALHEGVPEGVSPADNETGWRMALDRLAGLVESEA
ncbi:SRPBCC domain-containing protein [Dokdonella sp. MW10]|uniref:SRPBCC domain-containing protein n=1 Tax=Dokdonella sp. MW10 TaxID=2992926 RepID=UPI003F80AD5C